MQKISQYIFEKLKINKDTSYDKDSSDESTWEVGDIICAHGFRIEFFEIKSRSAKQFKLLELRTKPVDGYFNSATYKAIPHGSPKPQRIVKGIITKHGMNSLRSSMTLEAWATTVKSLAFQHG